MATWKIPYTKVFFFLLDYKHSFLQRDLFSNLYLVISPVMWGRGLWNVTLSFKAYLFLACLVSHLFL